MRKCGTAVWFPVVDYRVYDILYLRSVFNASKKKYFERRAYFFIY